MSSKLKAGTSTSGAVLDADTTGILELQTGSTPTTAVTIDTSQNVGIGTASPNAKLQISQAGNAGLNVTAVSGATVGFYSDATTGWVYTLTNYPLILGSNNTERMRIDSSGNVLIGTTSVLASASNSLQVKGTGNPAFFGVTNNGDSIVFRNASNTTSGTITINASTVSYNTSSDYRLKENIAPMSNALAKVSALKPVTYKWKSDGSAGEGFIAHELAEVVPDCVTGAKDATETYKDEDGNEQTRPVYQGVDTSFLVATLTAAIQELNSKIIALEAKVGI